MTFIYTPVKACAQRLILCSETPDLKLSHTQSEIFDGWKRPSEIFGTQLADADKPSNGEDVLMAMNDLDLVQDITTDCSVVASLCACMARGSKGLGTVRASLSRYPFLHSTKP